MTTVRSAIPGPKPRPLVGHLPELISDRTAFYRHLGETYGDVSRFRVGLKPMIFVNHPALIHALLTHPKATRDTLTRRLLGHFFWGLLSQEGETHLRQRRLIQPAFHRQRLETYAQVMVEETDALLREWRCEPRRDLVKDLKTLTLKIVARALFSAREKNAEVVEVALDKLQKSVIRKFRLHVALPDTLPIYRTQSDRLVVKTFSDIVLGYVAERRADPGDRGDLLSMLMAARDEDGSALSDQDLVDQSVTLLTAGHETTANTLSWAFYLLSRHPEVVEKLRAEVAVLEGHAPTMADLKRLPYTEQVIAETQRLYPVAWTATRTPQVDLELGGYPFTKGIPAMMSVYVTQRDARFFPEPERFDPERFSPVRKNDIPKHAFMPFGAGVHQCIGNTFALVEARLILARVVQRFVWRLEPGYEPQPSFEITLGISNGLPATVTPVG